MRRSRPCRVYGSDPIVLLVPLDVAQLKAVIDQVMADQEVALCGVSNLRLYRTHLHDCSDLLFTLIPL